jgi:hypothetical protein
MHEYNSDLLVLWEFLEWNVMSGKSWNYKSRNKI